MGKTPTALFTRNRKYLSQTLYDSRNSSPRRAPPHVPEGMVRYSEGDSRRSAIERQREDEKHTRATEVSPAKAPGFCLRMDRCIDSVALASNTGRVARRQQTRAIHVHCTRKRRGFEVALRFYP